MKKSNQIIDELEKSNQISFTDDHSSLIERMRLNYKQKVKPKPISKKLQKWLLKKYRPVFGS